MQHIRASAEVASKGGGPVPGPRAAQLSVKLRLGVVACVLLALPLSGCDGLVPGDPGHEVGIARIGDELHIFAPLCEGEKVIGVEVYDNEAILKEPSYDPSNTRFTKWKVEQPVDDDITRGWIVLGDDKAFRVVTVPGGGGGSLNGSLGMTLSIDHDGAVRMIGDGFSVKDAPVYPPGTGIKAVNYAFSDNNSHLLHLTPDEIRKRTNCP
jgi:hypothetical protein